MSINTLNSMVISHNKYLHRQIQQLELSVCVSLSLCVCGVCVCVHACVEVLMHCWKSVGGGGQKCIL